MFNVNVKCKMADLFRIWEAADPIALRKARKANVPT